MTAQIIDGKGLAETIKSTLRTQISALTHKGKRAPCIAVILVGENPASKVYVKHKHAACESIGMQSINHILPESTTEAELSAFIQTLNQDDAIDGILVQLPLPNHINPENMIEKIAPLKDVDGFHPYNLGRLAQRRPCLRPCTPYGVIKILNSIDQPIRSLNAVIIGASNIVGRPMALELLLYGCTTTVCHRFTQTHDLINNIQKADIVISAVGKPGIIQGEWIKPGSIVIDVGITRGTDGKLKGDVDFASAKERAGWITPVPGGVGPMTVAILLENTLKAYEVRQNIQA